MVQTFDISNLVDLLPSIILYIPDNQTLFTWQVRVKEGEVPVRKTISDFLPCTCNTDTPVHNSTAKIKFYYLENNTF